MRLGGADQNVHVRRDKEGELVDGKHGWLFILIDGFGQPKAWDVSEERRLMSDEGGRDRFFYCLKNRLLQGMAWSEVLVLSN